MGRKRKIVKELEITKIAAEGKGMARREGKVIFVENAVPGDIADVRILQQRQGHPLWFLRPIELSEHLPPDTSLALYDVAAEAAAAMIPVASQNDVLLQVGHLERFNPAVIALKEKVSEPQKIHAERLAPYKARGTEVNVILDLMIHDIDIILSVVRSKVKSVSASGVSVISDTPDIANARIEFENGCVANLTASRISLKNMRKSRFFQKDAYISVDFLEKKCEVVKMKDAPEQPGDFDMILQNAEGVKKQIYFDNPDISNNNAILDELETFANAIYTDTAPIVTLHDGTEALRVATMIIDQF